MDSQISAPWPQALSIILSQPLAMLSAFIEEVSDTCPVPRAPPPERCSFVADRSQANLQPQLRTSDDASHIAQGAGSSSSGIGCHLTQRQRRRMTKRRVLKREKRAGGGRCWGSRLFSCRVLRCPRTAFFCGARSISPVPLLESGIWGNHYYC